MSLTDLVKQLNQVTNRSGETVKPGH